MICIGCDKEKPLSNFQASNELFQKCKKCVRQEYTKAYYQANKGAYRKTSERLYRLKLAIVAEFKNKPCLDCGGVFHHHCMDFDHVRGKKLFSISAAVRDRRSLDDIKQEMQKCDLVCANCHRLRTYKRRACNTPS